MHIREDHWVLRDPMSATPPTPEQADAIATVWEADQTLGPNGIAARLLDHDVEIEPDTIRVWWHERRRQDERRNCSGECLRASDVGVDVPGDPIAYPHPGCEAHGDPRGEEQV